MRERDEEVRQVQVEKGKTKMRRRTHRGRRNLTRNDAASAGSGEEIHRPGGSSGG
jgi:hypothetical protein